VPGIPDRRADTPFKRPHCGSAEAQVEAAGKGGSVIEKERDPLALVFGFSIFASRPEKPALIRASGDEVDRLES